MRLAAFTRRASLPAITSLVALVALSPAIAQAETTTLVSSAANSLCIRPKGFKPLKGGGADYSRITTPHAGAYPDTGSACGIQSPSNPEAMGTVGAPAGSFAGSIPGASWVSINSSGETSVKPEYSIYDETLVLCENQAAAASLNGTMFAGSVAGAFLNGHPIGNQPFNPPTAANFNGPPAGGWPFASGSANFVTGLNTLQFVVYSGQDYTGLPDTGLDFSATVSYPKCEPQWFSNGTVLEGEEPLTSSGVLTFKANGPDPFEVKCKKTDRETIANLGEGPGVDSVSEFKLSGCKGKAPACHGSSFEVLSANLPWASHLLPGSPIEDAVEGMELVVVCGSTVLGVFKGTLDPTLEKSADVFGPRSGTLEDGLEDQLFVIGTDKLKGPPGDEKITAG